VVVLGRSGRREMHAAAPAQYVSGRGPKCRPLSDHRRWQMGRNYHPYRSALPAPHCYR
jgi:hypothetical protein